MLKRLLVLVGVMTLWSGTGSASAARFDRRVAPDEVAYLCDPAAGRFALFASADETSLDRSYPQRRLINVDRLERLGPADASGVRLRTGSRIQTLRCGEHRFRVRADYLNDYPQGANGMPLFLNVTIYRRSRPVVAGLRLSDCAMGMPIHSYGNCPEAYATLVVGRALPSGRTEVRTTVQYIDFSDPDAPEDTYSAVIVGPANR